MSYGVHLMGGHHLLRALGLDPFQMVQNFSAYEAGRLQGLADSFSLASGGMSPAALGSLLAMGLPAPMALPPPNHSHCPCPHQYAPPGRVDLGATPPGTPRFMRKAQRRWAKRLERMIRHNPFARQQLEMQLGGQIIPDGRNDGRLTVQPFPPGYFPAWGAQNQAAFNALGMMEQLSRAAAGFGLGGPAGGLMNSLMLGALGNLLGGGGGGYNGYMPDLPQGYSPGRGHNGGLYSGGAAGGSMFGAGDPEIARLLNDPSLTVEDKVTLMIMMIMKRMDKEIEKQAEYINKIQQQSGKGGKGGGGGGGPGGVGGGGGGGGGGGKSSPSIDVETMKLKRLIDKRGQMFDMLRQIIDKYNETAKNIIQSMGR